VSKFDEETKEEGKVITKTERTEVRKKKDNKINEESVIGLKEKHSEKNNAT
jgi:hypothetical protein